MSDAKPSPMPTPDLAGILNRPARTPAKPLATQDPKPRAAQGESTPQPASIASVPTLNPETRSALRAVEGVAERSKQPTPRQYLRPIVVYMPRDLHRRLRAAATERGTTATAITLEAVNATHDQLADAIIAQQETLSEAEGDLFDIPQARQATQPSVQTSIRVTDSQYQALVELAAALTVNRSRMISTAVRLHLA